jgi:hypothetical protein
VSYPFEILPTINGFEIIDSKTGRPLDIAETRREAAGKLYVRRNFERNRLNRRDPSVANPPRPQALLRDNRH